MFVRQFVNHFYLSPSLYQQEQSIQNKANQIFLHSIVRIVRGGLYVVDETKEMGKCEGGSAIAGKKLKNKFDISGGYKGNTRTIINQLQARHDHYPPTHSLAHSQNFGF